MPYSNIVFVKLFLSLFEEDDRYLYQLNESQQLLYIKMLYMAGSTNNSIPKNINFIKNKINYHHEDQCFLADIERIKAVFPKFIDSGNSYSFEKFEELHNYIGNSKGTPKELQRNSKGSYQSKSKNKSKSRIREDKELPPSLESVSEYCKERKNGINPQAFIDHYQANGWMRGRNKIRDWRACVRTWEARNKPKEEPYASVK